MQGDYTAAFTLTSFALALLMVFRTNSSYDRRGCARAGQRSVVTACVVASLRSACRLGPCLAVICCDHYCGYHRFAGRSLRVSASSCLCSRCRWWEARKLWGGLLGTTTDLVRQARRCTSYCRRSMSKPGGMQHGGSRPS